MIDHNLKTLEKKLLNDENISKFRRRNYSFFEKFQVGKEQKQNEYELGDRNKTKNKENITILYFNFESSREY
jgi:hypothetical protein